MAAEETPTEKLARIFPMLEDARVRLDERAKVIEEREAALARVSRERDEAEAQVAELVAHERNLRRERDTTRHEARLSAEAERDRALDALERIVRSFGTVNRPEACAVCAARALLAEFGRDDG